MDPPLPLEANATGPVLTRLVDQARVAEGAVLTAGEHQVLRRFLALPEGDRHLYARLLHRVEDVVREDGLLPDEREATTRLVAAGLLDRLVAPSRRLDLLRVPELKDACRGRGLPRGGRREELRCRLRAAGHVPDLRVLRVRYRVLFHRLERLWLRDPYGDYRVVVLDGLGVRPLPAYTPLPGPGAVPHRRALLDLEAARALLEQEASLLPHLDRILGWLHGPPPPAARRRFSVRAVAARLAFGAARELERGGRPQEAADLYQVILEGGPGVSGEAQVRAVRALEAAGRPAEALALGQWGRETACPATRRALERTCGRLARRHGLPWAPGPRFQGPPERRLPLEPAPSSGHRPRWRVDGEALLVEEAVAALLRRQGRRVLHGEGAPWSTLFALLFRDLFFLPVPGALPVPCLTGPLDLGTPDFALNREAAVTVRVGELRAGAGPALVRERDPVHRGEALGGAVWEAGDGAALAELAEALGGAGLARVMERLAREGFGARRGLPDLVVLPGPPAPLGSRPLPSGLLLVEVKGPGDQVRDEQAAWFDVLMEEGVDVELWRVEPVGR